VKVIVGILLITAVVETVGALILYSRWHGGLSPSERMFHSIFHSVSAFCNAGFSLQNTSLEGYVRDPVVNLTMMVQIVLGGLGFGVLLELMGLRVFSRLLFWRREEDRSKRRRLSVQTRLVLISSVALILFGSVAIYLLESGNPATLGNPELSTGERVQAALFQSVTARTAGFNTVPIGEMRDASKFLTLGLMFVGASPGSTGGGIKTVTAVILLLTIISLFRGRRNVEVFGRTMPAPTVSKAVVIVVSAAAVVAVATFILTVAEGERFPFLSIFFEVGSAFGTVGLSTGITSALGTVSKLTICLVMLVGRIGPLSLVIGLSQAREPRRYEYPEENVMIG